MSAVSPEPGILKTLVGSGPWRGPARWIGTYLLARDHKVIGLQFFFTALAWSLVAMGLAIAIRWQLAWPWQSVPVMGPTLLSEQGGQISPEFYATAANQYVTVIVFFVLVPILNGTFGSYLVPLMIGAENMAFPTWNMASYWMMWPASICVGASFFVAPTYASAQSQSLGVAESWCFGGVACVGIAMILWSANLLTTVVQMRAPGMTFFKMPMTVWGMAVAAIVLLVMLPLWAARTVTQAADRLFASDLPQSEFLAASMNHLGLDGMQLLHEAHPAVYILVLPLVGMISDIIATFSRKSLCGYPALVLAIAAMGTGALLWALLPANSDTGLSLRVIASVLWALVTAIAVSTLAVGWLQTMWAGRIQLTTSMLFAIGFVLALMTGMLSTLLMTSQSTGMGSVGGYYGVAHFHFLAVGAGMMGIFAALYFWFPKMFGRQMSEFWGHTHFALTLVFINATLLPMVGLAERGAARASAEPEGFEWFAGAPPVNRFITLCALATIACQAIFMANFLYSIFFGRRVGRNPWNSNTLEWSAPSPPSQGNFDFQPIVNRGPYEYGHPSRLRDFTTQTEPASSETVPAVVGEGGAHV